MNPLSWWYLLLIVGSLALAAETDAQPSCAWELDSYRSVDAVPETLITAAYAEFFEQLGGTVSAATIETMVAAQDPFSVPRQAGADLGSLRKWLSQFRQLIGLRGWDSPGLRTALLGKLRARIRATEAVQEQRAITLEKNGNGYSLYRSGWTPHRVSPDGHLLLTFDGKNHTVQAYDLEKRVALSDYREPIPFDPKYGQFSADGKFFYFPGTRNGLLGRVPVDGAELKWAELESFGTVEAGQPAMETIAITADPNVIVGRSDVFWRYDVASGKRTKVQLPAFPTRITDWGFIPSTGMLWAFTVSGRGTNRKAVIHRFDLNADGSATPLAKWKTSDLDTKQIIWSNDGKTAFTLGSHPEFLSEAGARPLPLPNQPSGEPVSLRDIKFHPTKNIAAALYGVIDVGCRLIWYDGTTGEAVADGPIPPTWFDEVNLAGDKIVLRMGGPNYYVDRLGKVSP